jgi:predicted DNA-binding protein YlxM (UPF0122 family)
MPSIAKKDIQKVRKMYIEDKYCMREIAEYFNVSLDAVVYAMRKNQISRRSMKEMIALRFERKPMSFARNKNQNTKTRILEAIGVMLYWAEGAKNPEHCSVDFTNSDPHMIELFMLYLRTVYTFNEKKLRCYLYCYSDQNVPKLMKFWSILTNIPLSQFRKPYVRTDFKKDGRKMKYGLVHIWYGDKKLLLDILKQIEKYKDQFCVGGRAVKYTSL